ncbi:MAG: hypothetical protein AAGA56_15740, partial [Myxococcota bacterium]
GFKGGGFEFDGDFDVGFSASVKGMVARRRRLGPEGGFVPAAFAPAASIGVDGAGHGQDRVTADGEHSCETDAVADSLAE